MFRNVCLGFSLPFILNFILSVSTGYWITDLRTAKQLNLTEDINEINVTSFIENLPENSTANPDEGDTLFWKVSDTNETTEDGVMPQMDDQKNQDVIFEEANNETEGLTEEDKEANVQGSVFTEANPMESTELDEKIVLQRMNCHLEMAVQSTHDLKLQIKFGRLQNYTSGECCITLTGPESNLLAVLISNIHLYKNGSDEEVLKVITLNHGSAFILKEYYNYSTYQPLILTEAHTVYLVLQYRVTTISSCETESYFNLEVLTYHKNENYSHTISTGNSPAFPPTKDHQHDKFFTNQFSFSQFY